MLYNFGFRGDEIAKRMSFWSDCYIRYVAGRNELKLRRAQSLYASGLDLTSYEMTSAIAEVDPPLLLVDPETGKEFDIRHYSWVDLDSDDIRSALRLSFTCTGKYLFDQNFVKNQMPPRRI